MRELAAIYFARGLISGLLKIGRTWNVPARLSALASAVEPVELLATISAPPSLERDLHRRFAAALEPSRGREWFRDDGSIRSFIEALPTSQRGSRVFMPGAKRKVHKRSASEIAASRRDAMQGVARHREMIGRAHGHAADLPVRECPRCLATWEAASARRKTREAKRAAARIADPLLYPLVPRPVARAA